MQIKEAIIQGLLPPNSQLPSIRSLAAELQVSVITTKRSYEELENEGFITTVPGKGSYVAPKSNELLKELKMRTVEEKLEEAIDSARLIGLTLDDLVGLLKILYLEE
jgi:GntR family transcriptional regulator